MALLRSLSLDEKGGASLVSELEACEIDDKSRPQPAETAEQHVVEEESSSGAYLPSEVLRVVQGHLIAGEPLGIALLNLLSMASVCRQWRSIAAELATGSSIAFDCFDNAFPSQPSVQRFRKMTTVQKEVVFRGAAKLMTGAGSVCARGNCACKGSATVLLSPSSRACALRAGYGDVLLSGEAISDAVLQELAAKNGALLSKCKVQAASVTDAGLTALVAHAKSLQSLEVQGLGKPCAGGPCFAAVMDELSSASCLPLCFDLCLCFSACRQLSAPLVRQLRGADVSAAHQHPASELGTLQGRSAVLVQQTSHKAHGPRRQPRPRLQQCARAPAQSRGARD